MHRFVWDAHYAPPEALNREFPISAILHDTPQYPLGAWAMPGRYTVKLTVDGKSYTKPLTLKMDPRIRTSESDLRKKFEMEAGIVEGMNESFEALQQVRSLRAQVKERSANAKGGLADSLGALDKQAAEMEGASESGFFGLPRSGKQPENFSTLNQHFGALLTVADSADAAPTTQAAAVYVELEDALGKLIARWQKTQQTDLAAVNSALQKVKLDAINPNKTVGGDPEVSEGEDEP